jgi:hypothetical protein
MTTPLLPTLLVALAVAGCASTTATVATAPPAPLPPPPTATVAAAPTPPTPSPPATASEVLARGRAPFDACYAAAKKLRPELPRTSVEMTFTMDDDGKLLNVDFAYRNRLDDAAKDCMRSAAEKVAFPPGLRGKQTGTLVLPGG